MLSFWEILSKPVTKEEIEEAGFAEPVVETEALPVRTLKRGMLDIRGREVSSIAVDHKRKMAYVTYTNGNLDFHKINGTVDIRTDTIS